MKKIKENDKDNIIELQNKYTNIEENKNLLKHNISKFKNEYKNNNYKL